MFYLCTSPSVSSFPTSGDNSLNGLKAPGSKQARLLQRQAKGRGWGTLICSYIPRLGPFLGFKILNYNLSIYFFFVGGGGSEK